MCTILNVIFLATDSSSVKVACDQQIGGKIHVGSADVEVFKCKRVYGIGTHSVDLKPQC